MLSERHGSPNAQQMEIHNFHHTNPATISTCEDNLHTFREALSIASKCHFLLTFMFTFLSNIVMCVMFEANSFHCFSTQYPFPLIGKLPGLIKSLYLAILQSNVLIIVFILNIPGSNVNFARKSRSSELSSYIASEFVRNGTKRPASSSPPHDVNMDSPTHKRSRFM